jgi:hypothetical protein
LKHVLIKCANWSFHKATPPAALGFGRILDSAIEENCAYGDYKCHIITVATVTDTTARQVAGEQRGFFSDQ